MQFSTLISDLPAYNRIWVVGDDFMSNLFGQYFQDIYNTSPRKGYTRTHYDVAGFCKGNLGLNGNIISRIRNAIAEGITKQKLLPRAILIVLDDDILDAIDHYDTGLSLALGKSKWNP